MNQEIHAMLEKSPSPVKWTIAFFVLVLGGIFLHIACFIALGLLVGLYFGNYKGDGQYWLHGGATCRFSTSRSMDHHPPVSYWWSWMGRGSDGRPV